MLSGLVNDRSCVPCDTATLYSLFFYISPGIHYSFNIEIKFINSLCDLRSENLSCIPCESESQFPCVWDFTFAIMLKLCGISEVNGLSCVLSDSKIYLLFLGSQMLMIFLASHVIASPNSLAFGASL